LKKIEEYNYVGNQIFITEGDLYKFYNTYTFHKGFIVIIHSIKDSLLERIGSDISLAP
jgi:hypothetical protein